MSNYIDTVSPEIRTFFNLLEPRFPKWLNDYIDTPELLKQQYISTTCGTLYSNLFNSHFFYSNLDHSIGVALIVWHFTHDKKQTLSGLFHDIATPAFKHCVDFLNGDYIEQESTEALTTQIISQSTAIMQLLKRDKITLSEVDNYHLYPIADNNTPYLSADRLEYSLSNALLVYQLLDFTTIKKLYRDIKVGKDSHGTPELEFSTESLAFTFVKITSELSITYREYKNKYSMQFIADILKKLEQDNLLIKSDLYNLKEQDIIQLIENSPYQNAFHKWQTAKQISTSPEKPKDAYSVNLNTKIRYIDPLVNGERISSINFAASQEITRNLSYRTDQYAYIENLSF